jgi:S1-C subfamily serine protease
VGDVVRSIDDHRVRTLRDMAPHLASYPAGGTLRLGGLRDAAPMSWTLTVGTYDVGRVNGWFDRLGLVIEEREGVIIVTGVRAGSPAASIGFERGDVIFSIDRIPVRDRARLQEHLLRNRQKGYFLLGFQRQRFRQHIGLQLPPPDPSF